MENKPKVKLLGKDGNIFNLMGLASRALKQAGQKDMANKMCGKIMTSAGSYDEALQVIMEFCDVC